MALKSLAIGLLAAACLAPSASALSCMRADLGQTMEQAKASDDIYYILVGSFQSTPPPKTKLSNDPNAPMNGIGAYTAKASFDGRILSNNPRWDHNVTRMPVDIDVSCAGPWCGGAPANGQEVIAFVKSRPGLPLQLSAGPCPDKIFQLTPKSSQIKKLRACFENTCPSDVPPNGMNNRY